MEIKFEDWGLIEFDEAFEKQKQYVLDIQASARPEAVIFCRHNPIVTLGRKTQVGDVTDWSGKTLEINRGGRATYHGPSQLVIYPILNLNGGAAKPFPLRDIHQYLRFLENTILDFLAQFCVDGETYSSRPSEGSNNDENATGVWVSGKKVAAIGIAIQKWITSHGVAINLTQDQEAFKGIKPCGFSIEQVTSLEQILRKKIDYSVAVDVIQKILVKKFSKKI